MTSRIRHITIDCRAPYPLAQFWAGVLGFVDEPEKNPNGPDDPEPLIGATMVDDRRNLDGTGWAVLADPEGNEFCVERSRSATRTPTTRTHARTRRGRARTPAGRNGERRGEA